MSDCLGERLAFARGQKNLTLAMLGEITGYSPAHLSKLERNLIKDPPLSTLSALAVALGVTVGFLVGEKPAVGWETNLADLFCEHIRTLSPAERNRLANAEVEERFARVVKWLCDRFPSVFTRTVIAHELALNEAALEDVMLARRDLTQPNLDAIIQMTGLPVDYFAGTWPGAVASALPAEQSRYGGVVRLAVQEGVQPDALQAALELICRMKRGSEAIALLVQGGYLLE